MDASTSTKLESVSRGEQLRPLLGRRVRVTLHTGGDVTVTGFLEEFADWGEVLLDCDGDRDYWPCFGIEEVE